MSPDTAGPLIAVRAAGLLGVFHRAGVLSAADVHVAHRLGLRGGESDQRVLLAVALAVRAVRSGSVCVALDDVSTLAPAEPDERPAAVTPEDLPWPFSLSAIVIAHITFCFPFVTMVVRARLASFNREQEEAAKDLGASEWRALIDVVVPHMKPGLVAGALLAFTLSLDDFVITFFTSGPNTATFPVKIYSMVRFSVTPEVNAISALVIALTVLLTAVAMRVQGEATIAAHGT